MSKQTNTSAIHEHPAFLIALGCNSIIGCIVFCATLLIADFVVPNHDWIADTISDLGAGKYEYIVDIGLYAFSASLISIALLCAHAHLGGRRWSFGVTGFAMLGLLVFLVGARNEYGDGDNEGVVIHIYLVYALGLLMAVIPFAMAKGAERAGQTYARILIGISILWVVCAPFFFFLPDGIDGIYERFLGLLVIGAVCTLAWMFIRRGLSLR